MAIVIQVMLVFLVLFKGDSQVYQMGITAVSFVFFLFFILETFK